MASSYTWTLIIPWSVRDCILDSLLDFKSYWINMNPAITKSIWKITHRNPFISFIFYSYFFLPTYCLFLFSPMEIKDMIRATFKQPTNMTSIFFHVIRGRCCRGNSGGDILDFLDCNLQKELFFRSYPLSGGMPAIVLYRFFFSLIWGSYLKGND